MKEMAIDRRQDIQELMIKFHCLSAKKDIGILCFGYELDLENWPKKSSSNSIVDGGVNEAQYTIPIQIFDSPSWTGVYGRHFDKVRPITSFKNYTAMGRVIQVICSGMTNNQCDTKLIDLEFITVEDIPPPPEKETAYSGRTLVVLLRLPGSTNDKLIELGSIISKINITIKFFVNAISKIEKLPHFMPIKKQNLQWIAIKPTMSVAQISFDLTEILQNLADYVLLTVIEFRIHDVGPVSSHYPIIIKNGYYYKAIGMCSIEGAEHFLNGVTIEEQRFEIH